MLRLLKIHDRIVRFLFLILIMHWTVSFGHTDSPYMYCNLHLLCSELSQSRTCTHVRLLSPCFKTGRTLTCCIRHTQSWWCTHMRCMCVCIAAQPFHVCLSTICHTLFAVSDAISVHAHSACIRMIKVHMVMYKVSYIRLHAQWDASPGTHMHVPCPISYAWAYP